MTRKESLLVEICNLRNQIAEIKGNTIVNIEEFSQTRKFRDEAAEWKKFELKLRIEELKKNLEKTKVEAVDFATLDTPAKWNSVCREAIWHNYDLMRPHTQLLFHDYFTERYGAKN